MARKMKRSSTSATRKPARTKAKAARKSMKKKKIASKAVKKAARKAVTPRKAPAPKSTATATRVAKPKKAVRARKPVRTTRAKAITRPTAVVRERTAVAAKKPAAPKRPTAETPPLAAPRPPRLDRQRRRLPEVEAEAFSGTSPDTRLLNSARSGHDEFRSELIKHTESSPELTAGDVDAKWQDAYAVGDEAPGGDNMTPDQDRVDDIGKALGIVYEDDEELMGGAELTERDAHRWELNPASKEAEDK